MDISLVSTIYVEKRQTNTPLRWLFFLTGGQFDALRFKKSGAIMEIGTISSNFEF